MAYEFPTRTVTELVTSFQTDFPELNITEQDFKQPTKDRWLMIYSVFMSEVAGFNSENLKRMQLTNSPIEYPELHTDSAFLWNLLAVMRHLLPSMGFESFGMNDIIRPDPKRTMRICSAYCNYYMFKQERLQVFDRIKQDDMAEAETRNRLEKENDQIQEQINQIHLLRATNEACLKQMQENIDDLQGSLKTLEETGIIVQRTLNQKKAANSDCRVKIAQVKEHVASAQQEKAKLASQIVQSPDRMKSEKERMVRQVGSLQKDKEVRLQRMVELRSNVRQLQGLTELCDMALKLINDIHSLIKKDDAEKRVLREIQEEAQTRHEAIHAAETKEQQLTRLLNVKMGKLDKMVRQSKMRYDDMTATRAQLKAERETLLQAHHHESQEKQVILEELQVLRQREMDASRAHGNKMQQLQDSYNDMLKSLDLYHINLGKSWESLCQHIDALIASSSPSSSSEDM